MCVCACVRVFISVRITVGPAHLIASSFEAVAATMTVAGDMFVCLCVYVYVLVCKGGREGGHISPKEFQKFSRNCCNCTDHIYMYSFFPNKKIFFLEFFFENSFLEESILFWRIPLLEMKSSC